MFGESGDDQTIDREIKFEVGISRSQCSRLHRRRYLKKIRIVLLLMPVYIVLCLYPIHTFVPVFESEQTHQEPLRVVAIISFWAALSSILPAMMMYGFILQETYIKQYWLSLAGKSETFHQSIHLTDYSISKSDSHGILTHVTGTITLERDKTFWMIIVNGVLCEKFFVSTISPQADSALLKYKSKLGDRMMSS